ncbi:ANTAR domain-containing protein [Actinocrispum sp. NPDC049592]|uniref:ANTAR domain-containing protein n=1 Tax=Actinocrispum sp. NPDC049592 TaxID=3154835 RepID=UPI00344324E6
MTGNLTDAADRWKPLNEQLWLLLDHIAADIPGCMGVSLTTRQHGGPLSVLATHGIAEYLAEAQLRHGGPITAAAATGDPVAARDLFADDRWPALDRDKLIEQAPELADQFQRVRGAAAHAGIWNENNTLVLGAALDRPAGRDTLAVLMGYERLTALTLTVAETAANGAEQILSLLASRAAIEQAKGAIVAVRRCSPDEAWETLRRASQQFNVKVRDLAIALVEYVADAPTSSQDGIPAVQPGTAARQAAQLLWAAFAGPPSHVRSPRSSRERGF